MLTIKTLYIILIVLLFLPIFKIANFIIGNTEFNLLAISSHTQAKKNPHLAILDQILNHKLDLPFQQYKFSDESKLVVLVLSSRENFSRRNLIRKTWARVHIYPGIEPQTDIYFLVGARYCPYPSDWLVSEYGCDLQPEFGQKIEQQNLTSQEQEVLQTRLDHGKQVQKQLIQEATYSSITCGKLVLLDMLDTYNNLTLKTKSGFRWAYNQLSEKHNYLKSKQKYFMKIDDDSVLHVNRYAKYLTKNIKLDLENSKNRYFIAGVLMSKRPVRNIEKPKWDEKSYKSDQTEALYPTYANGDSGYVISFDILKYIATNFDKLILYQNEDAAVGIWIHESPFASKVTYVDMLKYRLLLSRRLHRNWCDPGFDRHNLVKVKKQGHLELFNKFSKGFYFTVGIDLNSTQIENCWNWYYFRSKYGVQL